jgi:hypothetical protein
VDTSLTVLEAVKTLEIHSAEDNALAAGFAKELKKFQAEIEQSYRPSVDAAHLAHKTILAELNSQIEPYKKAESAVKAAMLKWAKEEGERVAAERRKAEAEAEARRKEAEALAYIGDKEAAAEIMAQPLELAREPEKVEGISSRVLWSAEVVDIKQLCLAIAQGIVPPEYVSANMPALNSMARMAKEAFAVPGCRAVSHESIGVRV